MNLRHYTFGGQIFTIVILTNEYTYIPIMVSQATSSGGSPRVKIRCQSMHPGKLMMQLWNLGTSLEVEEDLELLESCFVQCKGRRKELDLVVGL